MFVDDFNGFVSFMLFEGFVVVLDDINVGFSGDFGFGSDEVVGFVEDGVVFGVVEDGLGDVVVLELGDGDFVGVGIVGFVEDVLGGDFDVGVEVFMDEEEIEGWRGDDDFCSGSEVSIFWVGLGYG